MQNTITPHSNIEHFIYKEEIPYSDITINEKVMFIHGLFSILLCFQYKASQSLQ